jgi:hypothetical protein
MRTLQQRTLMVAGQLQRKLSTAMTRGIRKHTELIVLFASQSAASDPASADLPGGASNERGCSRGAAASRLAAQVGWIANS